MSEGEPQFLDAGQGANLRRIAYRTERGVGGMGLLWLSGFNSNMSGTKAEAIAAWAREKGFSCARFDYSGHGLSGGRFEDGTIGRWLEEAQAVCEKIAGAGIPPTLALPARGTPGGGEPEARRLILAGSSMGGYIALLLLRRLIADAPDLARRIAGLVLVAPAWDMTEDLLWKKMTDGAKRQIETDGVWPLPSAYGAPVPITRALIEEGRSHLIGANPFDPGRPVRVLQGLGDPDVPPEHARRLAGLLPGGHVHIAEIADGDHSLSRPSDLARLFEEIETVAQSTVRVHG